MNAEQTNEQGNADAAPASALDAVSPPSTSDFSRDPLLVYDNELHTERLKPVELNRASKWPVAMTAFAGLMVIGHLLGATGLVPAYIIVRVQELGWFVLQMTPFLMLIVLPPLWRNKRQKRGSPLPQAVYATHWHDQDAYRIAVAGQRKDLEAVFSERVDDGFFEPKVYRIWGDWPAKAIFHVLGLWLLGSALSLALLSGLRSSANMGTIWSLQGAWDWVAAAGLGWLPMVFLWPCYVRVSPGQLEHLRYDLLGRRLVERHAFDLRTARLRMYMPGGVMFITQADGKTLRVEAPSIRHEDDLARTVVGAARWRGELQSLPTDRLSQ